MDKKIVLIGAGSAVFGPPTLNDIYQSKTLTGSTISLVDINEEKLDRVYDIVVKENQIRGEQYNIEKNLDRKVALKDADFVVCSIENGDRFLHRWQDHKIPHEHGSTEMMAENGGPGGFFHSARQIPTIVEIAKDAYKANPNVLFINYSNPMSRICLAIHRAVPDLNTVGLCHQINLLLMHLGYILDESVQDLPSKEKLAKNKEYRENVKIITGGLNHFAFVLDMEDMRTGKNLMNAFNERAMKYYTKDKWDRFHFADLTFEIYKRTGWFPYVGDNHLAEYVQMAKDHTKYEDLDDWIELMEQAGLGINKKLIRCHKRLQKDKYPRKGMFSMENSGERAVAIMEGLWKSEERFHTVISNLPVVLWAIDNDGMFTLSEGKGLEALGLKPREVVGQSVFEMYRDYPKIIEDIHKALSGKENNSIHQVGDTAYETKLQPIRDKEGTITGVSGVSIDVTERQLAEKLVKEQVQKLNEISKLKTDLLRRTSHELKTPLISIKGYTDLLLTLHADKFDDDVFSIIEEIKRGSSRLESLVKDLLESSQFESGKVQLKFLKEDLTFLINFCVRELRLLAKKRNHEIVLNVHDNLITLFEKEKVYDVVNNLLSNAIKYTPPGGTIEVKSEIKDGFYIISVKDNGIGLEKDEKSKLFRQFGKIERFGLGWDVEPGGSGLGLYISKKIIELHGGNIWLESEGTNKGSTFYFSLPIMKE